MEEIREGAEETGEENVEGGAAPLPTQMQLLSTWEVRRVPHNCVTRLCTLTVTRLQVRQSLEPSLPSLVVAVSMKTPHRFLRSNEIPLPDSGILDIPLQLTFCLQYPHFLKRGGNVLQIRVQRRKRYRTRPLGGYKTLAMGTVEMSQVLQAGYLGEVQLFSGKPPLPQALVSVGSLTSTPVYVEPQREGSSDEEEDDIVFSDYRGSDSDSGEGGEVYPHTRSHKLKSKMAKPSSRMLRLLGIKTSKTHTVVDELLAIEGEDPESAVTFASSVSDSEEDEEGIGGPSTPPRPTLSPFFGSDRCSMVSIPNSVRSAEVGTETTQLVPAAALGLASLKKYGSLEEAIQTGLGSLQNQERGSGLPSDEELGKGRMWVVGEGSVAAVLRKAGEGVLVGEEGGMEGVVSRLLLLLTGVSSWLEDSVFAVVVVGEDWLVSATLQAVLQVTATIEAPNPLIRMVVIPTCAGVVASRLLSLDEGLSASLSLDTDWSHITSAPLLQYVDSALCTHNMPVAQVILHRPSAEPLTGAQEPAPLPFVFSVSVGSMDADWEQIQSTSPPSASSGSEATELVVEYWTGKKEKEKLSLKVRCVTATCDAHGLNVTTLSRDKRSKGIRIRKKEKEGETGGSIVSLSTTQLLCRPSNKQETLSVVVDGVEWREVSSVKMVATIGQFVTIATQSPAPSTDVTNQ